MATEPVVLAVDLGGTNVRWAVVNKQGEILGRWERATASMPEQEVMITTLAKELLASERMAKERQTQVRAVSLGVPGRILPEKGVVVFSPNVEVLNNCPLVSLLHTRVPWPVFLENDANLFTLGEHWLGAGNGHPHMLGITLGTGVGGGLILNDRLWSGTAGTAGEVGHLTIDPEGRKCHCGNRGCLETMASGFWTSVWVREQLERGAASWLRELWEKDKEALDGETLVTAARLNDPLALRAFERVGQALGVAIADVVHLLGLSCIVIGGRFARAWELFENAMQAELYHRLTMFPLEALTIVPAKLGDDAGLLGAARLAWDRLENYEQI